MIYYLVKSEINDYLNLKVSLKEEFHNKKPMNRIESHRDKDVYYDYFDKKEDAQKYLEESKLASNLSII